MGAIADVPLRRAGELEPCVPFTVSHRDESGPESAEFAYTRWPTDRSRSAGMPDSSPAARRTVAAEGLATRDAEKSD